jgi:hypothetical protein
LIQTERDDLVLDVAGDQRVIHLLADVTRQMMARGRGERHHDVPGGVIRTTDVAHLAEPHQIVERPQRFLDRHEPIGLG